MPFGALGPAQLINLLLQLVGTVDTAQKSEKATKSGLTELERARLNTEQLRGYGVPLMDKIARGAGAAQADVANNFATNQQNMMLGGAAPALKRTPIDPFSIIQPFDATLGRAGLQGHLGQASPELLRPAFKGDPAQEIRSELLSSGRGAPGTPWPDFMGRPKAGLKGRVGKMKTRRKRSER